MNCQVFRRAYNIHEDELELDPVFFDVEIWDMFPHDHPWLDEEPELMNAEKKEMAEYLDQVI